VCSFTFPASCLSPRLYLPKDVYNYSLAEIPLFVAAGTMLALQSSTMSNVTARHFVIPLFCRCLGLSSPALSHLPSGSNDFA
jgi:hypothetical protein